MWRLIWAFHPSILNTVLSKANHREHPQRNCGTLPEWLFKHKIVRLGNCVSKYKTKLAISKMIYPALPINRQLSLYAENKKSLTAKMFIKINIFGSKAVFSTSLLLKRPFYFASPDCSRFAFIVILFPLFSKNLICNDYLITLNF